MRGLVVVAAFGLACLAASNGWAYGGEVLAELASPVDEPMGLAVRGEHLWISDWATRSIVQVRKTDGQIVSKLATPGFMPTGVAWQGEVLFAADRRLDWIARRRPDGATDQSPLPYYEKWATGLTHDGAQLWAVDARAGKIHRLDPVDGTTIESFAAPAGAPTGMAFDGQQLWVADHVEDSLYRVDRSQGLVTTVLAAPGPYASALAVDGDSLWVADYQQRRLYRVALPDETPYVEDQPRKVHASYEVLYRAEGGGKITSLVARLALPRDIPGQHLLSEIALRPKPQRIVTDRWGQKVAVFELGELASGEVKKVAWEGDFALFRTRFHLAPERVDAAPLPADLDAYLGDDKKYDLSAEVIGELVDELTKGRTGTYERARAIYQHLTEVITYERSGGWNNAAAVLARGTGSCSEYTFALVALLRRAGIPARYVGAISERGDEASFDDVFHRWAEAYMPGYGWVPVDANAGYGKPPGERGSYFGGRSNRHVVTTIGGGASAELDWTYNHHQSYQSQASATLTVRAIARYRPLQTDGSVQPHEAPAVLAPRLTAPPTARPPTPPVAGDWSLSPWWLVLALAGGLGLGVLAGRWRAEPASPPR